MSGLRNIKWKHYISYVVLFIVTVVLAILSFTGALKSSDIYLLEKIAILGIAEQYFAMDYTKAETVWIKFVETLGKANVPEWLSAMSECLFADEEEVKENSFLAQMRAKAEKKNARNGGKTHK